MQWEWLQLIVPTLTHNVAILSCLYYATLVFYICVFLPAVTDGPGLPDPPAKKAKVWQWARYSSIFVYVVLYCTDRLLRAPAL